MNKMKYIFFGTIVSLCFFFVMESLSADDFNQDQDHLLVKGRKRRKRKKRRIKATPKCKGKGCGPSKPRKKTCPPGTKRKVIRRKSGKKKIKCIKKDTGGEDKELYESDSVGRIKVTDCSGDVPLKVRTPFSDEGIIEIRCYSDRRKSFTTQDGNTADTIDVIFNAVRANRLPKIKSLLGSALFGRLLVYAKADDERELAEKFVFAGFSGVSPSLSEELEDLNIVDNEEDFDDMSKMELFMRLKIFLGAKEVRDIPLTNYSNPEYFEEKEL